MTSMWTGVNGMRVNQTSLNTTAHNISNIDTKGYVRQQILQKDSPYNTIGMSHISPLQVGVGSSMDAIRQVRDVFLDKSYRLEVGRQEFYQVQSDAAKEIETILGEFGDTTFSTSLSDLWSAITDVAEEPDSIVKRSILASTATSFISYAEALDDQLNEYQKKVNEKIVSQVNRINDIGDEIQKLNTEIVYQESSGQNANDYRDQRNILLDELAGYVNITYQEDIDGRVLVNVEGTSFVTLGKVFHMETEEIVEKEKQDLANRINELISGKSDVTDNYEPNILGKIKEAVGTDPANADPEAVMSAVRNSEAWKELSKYGNLGLTAEKNADGEPVYSLTFNGIQLAKTVNGDLEDPATDVLKYEPQPTGLYNVIWSHTGGDVFCLTGEYSSFNNTDVGSLKGILVARGNYAADYLDIPQKAEYFEGITKEAYLSKVNKTDYCDQDGNFIVPDGESNYKAACEEKLKEYEKDYKVAEEAYNKAVEKYNRDLGACLLTSTQAQIDLLVNKVVTTVNDVLCPNIDITAESIQKNLELNGAQVNNQPATAAKIVINGTEYTIEEANEAGLQILDIENASVGMDEDETIGEALFERKNMKRYTEATVKDANGDVIKDKDGNPLKVKVYNKEYDTDVHSMFTIGQVEVNRDMVDNVSKMPLSHNKYSDLYGGYDYDVCQKILDVWGTDSIQLSPNVLTPYNYGDYYDAVSGNVGTMSGLYGSELNMLEETVHGVSNSRESILGVSSEEELTNLIMYQHAYNASSRYINTINEMLETLLNLGR